MGRLAQEDSAANEYPLFIAALAGLAASGADDRVWRDLVNALPAAVYITDATGRIIGKVIGASKVARDITECKQAQARQDMLTRELHHRTKNLFAVVQSVVSRSFTGKQTVKDAETAVKNRLRSLAQTHALLIEKDWSGADLAAVVRTEMSPYPDRVTIDGPTLMLSSQAAQNFALAVHELATNAAKYGALSDQAGWVHISWSVVQANGDSQYSFRWQERGGPLVEPPAIKGFGAVVLEQVMAEYFAVPPKIEFASSGVWYELKGPLQAVTKLH